MLRVFYGGDRAAAEKEIKRILGEGYEVRDGESLTLGDLPTIFQGTSLFGTEKRCILLKDVSENSVVWGKLAEYADTSHEVIAWEMKLDKRSVGYKQMKEAGVELREFAELRRPEANLVFGILETALRDGKKAVEMVEKIELEQDPFMFFGLLVTQALKRFEATEGGVKERRVVKELAKLDMDMKSSTVEPWMLVKSFLVRVGEL